MRFRWLGGLCLLLWAHGCLAGEFGHPGGALPPNLPQVMEKLRQDPYDLELLISYGTSKGGSAGHLALNVRDTKTQEETVYSANFYADRSSEHAQGFYTERLMMAIPKQEYLYHTRSSIGESASFGLDFGEVYKRSVLGVRVFGVPAAEKAALVGFFQRLNQDYLQQVENTEYHQGPVLYGYMNLNCAKTIGSAFRFGVGYQDLLVKNGPYFSWRKLKAAVTANIPTEMALKLMRVWHKRGYAMDVVLYRKYPGSAYVDPHDEDAIAFKDLPNRFPSVLSRDFSREADAYQDYDNLFAMYLFHYLNRYQLQIDPQSQLLQLQSLPAPFSYAEAARHARQDAKVDSQNFARQTLAPLRGTAITP